MYNIIRISNSVATRKVTSIACFCFKLIVLARLLSNHVVKQRYDSQKLVVQLRQLFFTCRHIYYRPRLCFNRLPPLHHLAFFNSQSSFLIHSLNLASSRLTYSRHRVLSRQDDHEGGPSAQHISSFKRSTFSVNLYNRQHRSLWYPTAYSFLQMRGGGHMVIQLVNMAGIVWLTTSVNCRNRTASHAGLFYFRTTGGTANYSVPVCLKWGQRPR